MKIEKEGRFAFVELDSLDFGDDADLEPIFGPSAINESGEIIEIDGGELRKEDYERVKAFVGDRMLYFNERRFFGRRAKSKGGLSPHIGGDSKTS